jgi:4a-hydroxytetrahydrobiopterin dehydratase
MNKDLKNSWVHFDNTLRLELSFNNFMEAVGFINEVAKIAEDLNHHPDLCLYRYKYLQIDVYTHNSNKLTAKDRELAQKIDEMVVETV